MTDKPNPDKPNADKVADASKAGAAASEASKAGDPKRPYATLDLKAIEVPQARPKTDAKPTAPLPGETAKAADAAASKAAAAKMEPAKPNGPAAQAAKPSGAAAGQKFPPIAAKTAGGVGPALSHLMAGIVGGAMAWYGVTTLGPQVGLPFPNDSKAAVDAVKVKLAALEKSVADKASAGSGDVAAKLKAAEEKLARLDGVSKAVGELGAAQAKLTADAKALADKVAANTGATDATARIAKLEEQLRLMADAAKGDAQTGKLPQLAAIAGSLSNLDERLTHELAAVRKSVAQEMEQRLTLTNETSEAAKTGTTRIDRDLALMKSASAVSEEKVAKLRADEDRLATAVQGIRDDGNVTKTAVESLKSDVEAKLKTVAKPADVASAVAPVVGKLSALEQNVQSVVKSEAERKTNSERILLALELNNLKRVLERGQPYASELAAVTKAAGGKIDLTILERYKDSGIATIATLASDFGPVSAAIVEAGTEPVQGSLMDRVMAGAKSVIRVRKISYEASDKSAEATAGRMEAALKDGRMNDVLAEAKNIPAKAQSAAQDWLVKIEARAAVERAIAGLEAALKTSIAGAPADAAPAPAVPAQPAKPAGPSKG